MTSGDGAAGGGGVVPPSAQNQAPWSVQGAAVLTGRPSCAGACRAGCMLDSPWARPGPDLGPTWTGPRPYAGALARAPARAHWHAPLRGRTGTRPCAGTMARGALCAAVSAYRGRGGRVSVRARVRSRTGRV